MDGNVMRDGQSGGNSRIFICDSVEDGIAVLLLHEPGTVDHIRLEIPAAELVSLTGEVPAANQCYRCTVTDGKIVSARKVTNPTAGENHRRLSRLFKERK